MPANIITSGDYSLGLNSGNAFVVTGLISSTGNIAGAYLLGNGSLLSGVQITNGTSNIVISGAAANITMAVANATGNIITVTNTGMFITGDLTVSGNATLSGNISGDHIDNGTTAIDIAAPNGNANITVGGVSNIAVFATTGVYVTGLISATSNVIANNVMATNIVNVASHTGSVVSVTANVTGGNLVTGGLITATSNIQGGNILTAGLVSSTSNIQGGNLLTGGLISSTGTVTGSSLLGSVVSVTANITGGNVLTGGLISATGNITGGNINTATVRNSSAALTLSTGSGNINLNPTGNVVLNSTYINGLSQPVQDNDAASKIYVDNAVSTALTYHSPVAAATTTTLATATSGTITYTQPNGAGNGVGATLTTTGTFLLIDTANIQTVGTRVLIKDEGNAVFNGVYTYANTTAIVRATDADQYGSDSTEALSLNDYFFVTGGTTNAGAAFVVSAPTGTITFGTSNIVFSQFSSSQTYSANTSAGISISGTVINAKTDNSTTAFDGGGNIIVKTSAQLVTPNIGAATGTSLSATGNVQGGNLFTAGSISSTGTITSAANIVSSQYFIGNGSQLSGLFVAGSTGGAIVSGTSNVRVALDANTTVGVAGTTVGTFASTGLYIPGLISAAGNVTGNYFIGNGSQLTGLSASKIYNGTSEANIGASSGNANITIGGTSNVVVVSTAGMYVSGLSSTTGNVISGNVTTAGLITATGNITGGNLLTAGLASVTGNILGGNILTGALVSASTVVAAGNVTGGNILTGGLISATSSITAAANITGGNILTAGLMSSTANITGGNLLTAGLVSATGNVTGSYILGNGACLSGVITSVANINNGTSNITVVSSGGNISVGVGGTSNVAVWATTGEYITGLISASGNITGGNLDLTYMGGAARGNLTGGNVSMVGNITGGNVLTAGLVSTGGNITTAGQVSAAGAITGANILTAGEMSSTGNATHGNIITGGLITATGNVASAGNILAQGLMSSTGNAIHGNVLTGGLVSATGNVTGGNLLAGATISTGGNIFAFFNVSATGTVFGSNFNTTGLISATSNITGGNILTGGLISATSSITGGTGLFGTTTNLVFDSVGVARAGVFAGSNTSTTINSSTAALAIVNNDTTTNNWAQLNFAAVTGASTNQYSSGIIAVQFGARTNGQYPTGTMTFSTSSSLNVAPSEKMRIDSSGNVGIGNTNPGVKLQVTGTTIASNFYTGTGTASAGTFGADSAGTGASIIMYGSTGANPGAMILSAGSSERMRIDSSGNVGIGNTAPTTALGVTGAGYFSGNITGGNLLTGGLISAAGTITVNSGSAVTAIINGAANGVGNIGSTGTYFNTVFAKATSAQYADLAEAYAADAEYEPGTVVVFGGTHEITISTTNADTAVAGVISTNPSYLMNSGLEAEHRAIVALTGRVPTRVLGPVTKGAMMVTAGNGYAQACATPTIGTVIGKSLENFNGDLGVIEIVVGRV